MTAAGTIPRDWVQISDRKGGQSPAASERPSSQPAETSEALRRLSLSPNYPAPRIAHAKRCSCLDMLAGLWKTDRPDLAQIAPPSSRCPRCCLLKVLVIVLAVLMTSGLLEPKCFRCNIQRKDLSLRASVERRTGAVGPTTGILEAVVPTERTKRKKTPVDTASKRLLLEKGRDVTAPKPGAEKLQVRPQGTTISRVRMERMRKKSKFEASGHDNRPKWASINRANKLALQNYQRRVERERERGFKVGDEVVVNHFQNTGKRSEDQRRGTVTAVYKRTAAVRVRYQGQVVECDCPLDDLDRIIGDDESGFTLDIPIFTDSNETVEGMEGMLRYPGSISEEGENRTEFDTLCRNLVSKQYFSGESLSPDSVDAPNDDRSTLFDKDRIFDTRRGTKSGVNESFRPFEENFIGGPIDNKKTKEHLQRLADEVENRQIKAIAVARARRLIEGRNSSLPLPLFDDPQDQALNLRKYANDIAKSRQIAEGEKNVTESNGSRNNTNLVVRTAEVVKELKALSKASIIRSSPCFPKKYKDIEKLKQELRLEREAAKARYKAMKDEKSPEQQRRKTLVNKNANDACDSESSVPLANRIEDSCETEISDADAESLKHGGNGPNNRFSGIVDTEMQEYIEKEYSARSGHRETTLSFAVDKPLGFVFDSQKVRTIRHKSQAERLGVRIGWDIVRVGRTSISSKTSAKEIFQIINREKNNCELDPKQGRQGTLLDVTFRIQDDQNAALESLSENEGMEIFARSGLRGQHCRKDEQEFSRSTREEMIQPGGLHAESSGEMNDSFEYPILFEDIKKTTKQNLRRSLPHRELARQPIKNINYSDYFWCNNRSLEDTFSGSSSGSGDTQNIRDLGEGDDAADGEGTNQIPPFDIHLEGGLDVYLEHIRKTLHKNGLGEEGDDALRVLCKQRQGQIKYMDQILPKALNLTDTAGPDKKMKIKSSHFDMRSLDMDQRLACTYYHLRKLHRQYPVYTYNEELRNNFLEERKRAGLEGVLEDEAGSMPSRPRYPYRTTTHIPGRSYFLHKAPSFSASRNRRFQLRFNETFYVDRLVLDVDEGSDFGYGPTKRSRLRLPLWLRVVSSPLEHCEPAVRGYVPECSIEDIRARSTASYGWRPRVWAVPIGFPAASNTSTSRPHAATLSVSKELTSPSLDYDCASQAGAPLIVKGMRVPLSRNRGRKFYALSDSQESLASTSDPDAVYPHANLLTFEEREQQRIKILKGRIAREGYPSEPYQYLFRNLHFDISEREPSLWSIFRELLPCRSKWNATLNSNHRLRECLLSFLQNGRGKSNRQTELKLLKILETLKMKEVLPSRFTRNPNFAKLLNVLIPDEWYYTLNSTSIIDASKAYPGLNLYSLFLFLHSNPSIRKMFPHNPLAPGDRILCRFYRLEDSACQRKGPTPINKQIIQGSPWGYPGTITSVNLWNESISVLFDQSCTSSENCKVIEVRGVVPIRWILRKLPIRESVFQRRQRSGLWKESGDPINIPAYICRNESILRQSDGNFKPTGLTAVPYLEDILSSRIHCDDDENQVEKDEVGDSPRSEHSQPFPQYLQQLRELANPVRRVRTLMLQQEFLSGRRQRYRWRGIKPWLPISSQ